MEYQETVTIPSTVGINMPFDVWTPDITTNSESEFENHDTRKDKIEEIILEKLRLEVISPSDNDFRFLNDIYVYIDADGLDEKLMAWKENIPDNVGKVLELNCTDDNIEAYIKKDVINFRVKTVTDRVITQDHEIQLDAEFFVDARLLG
ncbi:MAG: hypothetical protein U9Q98_03860 [Bacteroidota bacterium]|nr:hypothetical protein [Bacteroidota bacterium]